MSTSSTLSVIRPMVLVVDDDPAVLEALNALLVPRLDPIFRVESASSGEEALEIIGESGGHPDLRPVALVISDEKMPGMAGTDLLVAVRQHPAHRDGGRIIVTGYAGLPSAKKAINEAEVDRYFAKPWDDEGALLPAVGEILSRFASKRKFDQFLDVARAEGRDDLAAVHTARCEWWEYLSLMGAPTEGGDGDTPSEFSEPEDEDADLFIAYRRQPAGDQPAGTIRLRSVDSDKRVLDRLAFVPAEAGDEMELFLVRAALVHAALEGVIEVGTAAPRLRREIYETLGFRETDDQSGSPGAVSMAIRPSEIRVSQAWVSRLRSDGRLCMCAQTNCPARDYLAERRGYLCPLDLREGRTPTDFPFQTKQ